MLLAIDTTTRSASVALHDGTHVVASRSWRSVVNHSAELMPAIVQVLKSRDTTPRSLDAVAVALGPGGFSALRTGLSVAKGIGHIVADSHPGSEQPGTGGVSVPLCRPDSLCAA